MSRRIGLLAALVLVAAIFPAVQAGASSFLVVDGDGLATPADCDSLTVTPHTTIPSAITAASAGDIIIVCPGTYSPTAVPGILVDKPLTISGTDMFSVIVSGAAKNGSVVDGQDVLFSVTADSVTISDLTIDLGDDTSDYDVGVFSPNDGSVDGLVIRDARLRFASFGNATGEQLVHLGGGSGNTVVDSSLEVASLNSSVYLGDGTNTALVFSGNTLMPYSGSSGGVGDFDGGGTAINSFGPVTTSAFSNSTFTKTGIGIYLGSGTADTTNVTVTGNSFTGNTSATYGAVVITSEVDGTAIKNIDVMNNTFSASAGPAVRVFDTTVPANADVDGATIDISDNSFAGNNGDGLQIGTGVTGTVRSECNWWGTADGPSGVGPGTGDTVTPQADYIPWRKFPDLLAPCPSVFAANGGVAVTVTGPTGPVTATVLPTTTTFVSGFSLLGAQITLTAPVASPAGPYEIELRIIPSSMPPGEDFSTLEVFRNGVLVPACLVALAAVPDPCVADRGAVGVDTVLTIRTSMLSAWSLGVSTPSGDISNACPAASVPEDGFVDVPLSNFHEAAIDCIRWYGVTLGTGFGTYTPGAPVLRGEMASFLVRVLQAAGVALPVNPPSPFVDDQLSIHQLAIDQLAALGLTNGTSATTFSPFSPVTREQMAKFLVSVYEYVSDVDLPRIIDAFSDDNTSLLQLWINAAAAGGFTTGVSATQFEPQAPVLRDQMGSFLARVLNRLVVENLVDTP